MCSTTRGGQITTSAAETSTVACGRLLKQRKDT